MARVQIILIAVGLGYAALVAESHLGSSRYTLNGATYAVPHKYEFERNFSVPWLAFLNGLGSEPDQSIWLLFPAEQLAKGIPGYTRWFHGYSEQVPADAVINVLGGEQARDFERTRRAELNQVCEDILKGDEQRSDPITNWTRIYWLPGLKGTPGDGFNDFYLLPRGGVNRLPPDWRVPRCLGSPDVKRRETFYCYFTIYRRGLTFGFSLRQENLEVANRVPDYVAKRLGAWRS